MLAAIIQRLQDQVPALDRRVEAAASLAALLGGDRLPQVTPAAHVIPSEISGGRRVVLHGQYDQDLTRVWTVLLTVRSDSGTGARALETLPAFLDEIMLALAGWVPVPGGHEIGFRRCRLLTFQNGTFVYEFAFDQASDLRIIT